jgi:hypothetical protein
LGGNPFKRLESPTQETMSNAYGCLSFREFTEEELEISTDPTMNIGTKSTFS